MIIKLLGKEVFSVDNEKRSTPPAAWVNAMKAAFGDEGHNSDSGVSVTDKSSLKFSAVFACVNLISSTIAGLPLHVYKKTDSGREIFREHPIYPLLHDKAGVMNAFTFKQAIVTRMLLRGNGYARIWRNEKYEPIELELIDNDEIEVRYNKKSRKIAYKLEGQSQLLNEYDILHIKGMSFDGIVGLSVLEYARESIGLGLANQEFGARFFGDGTNLGGFLEHPGSFGQNDDAYRRLQNSFEDKYKGLKKSHGVIILENGMKFNKIGMQMEDAQWIESRQFQVSDIARFFGVQSHKINDLSRSTNNNIEQQSIEFVRDTLLPRLVSIEQEANNKMFKEEEKGKVFSSFNVNGLLRGDAQARGEYYSKMASIGAMNINEIRQLEGFNEVENGNTQFVPVNLQTLTKAISNTETNGNQ